MISRNFISRIVTRARYSLPQRHLQVTSAAFRVSFMSDQDQVPKRSKKRVGIVGVPTSFGQLKSGTDLGPQILREASLIQKLQELEIDVKDYGDVEIEEVQNDSPSFKLTKPRTHALNSIKISDAVAQVVSDGRVCVTLGGDHSLGLGSVHGHASVYPDVCVIWIDAHADLNTPLTSFSGNFHGMPTSFLIQEVQEYVPAMDEFANLRACIRAEDIVYIGLRQLDPAEMLLMDKYKIQHYSMHDIDRKGIVQVLQETLKHLKPGENRPIHLSIDIDSLDPLIASSTGTPVCGGLTLREILYIAEEVYNTGALSVIDLVEVNPQLNVDNLNETVGSALAILMKCLGDSRLGYLPDTYVLEKPEDYGMSSRAEEYVEYDED